MTCRRYEGGALPWDKIQYYATDYKKLDPEFVEIFTEAMFALDSTYQEAFRKDK